jgi:hypothetical protein
MKKNSLKYFFLLFALPFLFSCERDLETEGISRITNYPSFTLTGGEIMTVVQGDASFTVPDPVVTEGGQAIPFKTSVLGSKYIDPAHSTPAEVYPVNYSDAFDVNTPGMYIFTYSATNSDGYDGSAQRIVFVLDKAADPNVDLSGSYASGTSPEAEITKVADGVWFSTNVWGGGSTVKIAGYIISPDGISLQVPLQESLVPIYGYGTRNQTNGTLNLLMSRPTFATPLFNQVKNWVKI